MKRAFLLAAGLTAAAGNGEVARADAPAGRYIVEADTVKDSRTGLTWQRAPNSWKEVHAAAVSSCQGLVLAGYDDWRLPTVNELLSLADPTEVDPAIDIIAFPGTASENFWTASPYVSLAGNAWIVNFFYGFSHFDATDNAYRARCVR